MAITNGGQFSFRPTPGLSERIKEFVEFNQEQTGTAIKTDKEIFEALFEIAESKYAPYIDNSKIAEDSKKEVEKYQSENENLKEQVKELQSQLNDLKNQLADKSVKINNISSKIDDVLIHQSDINPVLKRLLDRYLKTDGVIKSFAKANKNGLYDGYFDKINTGDYKTDLKNLILTTVLNSCMGQELPSVTKNQRIKNAINKAIKNFDL